MESTGIKMLPKNIIDLPSKDWRAFLEDQPNRHPEYFKDPFSEMAMNYFKEMLESICQRAIQNNSCTGFYSFVQFVNNDHVRALMFTWMDSYSPIRQIKTKNGVQYHEVIRDYVPRCSITEAKCHPYYTLKVKPIKIYGHGRKVILETNSEVDETILFDTSRPASSDLDFSIKMAKMAFNKFMRERSLDTRKILIDKINLIPIGSLEKKGKPFLQGGAPGLRK